MNLLVTGATGFIGKRLVSGLRKDGHDLRILSKNKQLKGVIHCDLQNDNIPNEALSNIDIVLHLAGYAHDMRGSNKIKDRYYRLNVNATVQLAKLAVKAGVKKFIFVSSVKAGGLPYNREGFDENNFNEQNDIYGSSKREAELKLLEIHRQTNMNISIIRPSLVYGPNMKGNLQLMLSAMKNGWFPPLPETGNKRSMIHVDDLVRAIQLLIIKNEANGEIFIATDGITYSSRDIYEALCTVLGKPIPKWSLPKFIFSFAGLISSRIKYKVNKLLGDEFYSSSKLEALGFKAKKTLKDINETDF